MSVPHLQNIDLSAWPEPLAQRLHAFIRRHAHRGEYAVFDADQTCYQHDLTEPLLAYLEQQGLISRDTLAPELRLMPFLDDAGAGQESLYGYYRRLCALDDNIGYAWIAQSFTGLSLRQLKTALDALLASAQALPVRYWLDGRATVEETRPPRMVKGMQQLLTALQQQGIAVYIVSAGLEEAVRMVLADPRYGYHVPAENVIGVTTLLRHPETGANTTARKLIAAGAYRESALMDYRFSSHLWAPLTWYEGKTAAIKTYIDPTRKPILVAGDTPASDGPMLFDATDVARGGLRLFIERGSDARQQLERMQLLRCQQQAAMGQVVEADQHWLIVSHQNLF